MKYIKKFERNDLQEFNIINNIYQSILDNVRSNKCKLCK